MRIHPRKVLAIKERWRKILLPYCARFVERYPPVGKFKAKLAKIGVNDVVETRSVLLLAVYANPFIARRPILKGAR